MTEDPITPHTRCNVDTLRCETLFIYLFIYLLPEIINVTITCKQV